MSWGLVIGLLHDLTACRHTVGGLHAVLNVIGNYYLPDSLCLNQTASCSSRSCSKVPLLQRLTDSMPDKTITIEDRYVDQEKLRLRIRSKFRKDVLPKVGVRPLLTSRADWRALLQQVRGVFTFNIPADSSWTEVRTLSLAYH